MTGQCLEGLDLAIGPRLRRCADQGHEDGNEREREGDDERRDPVEASDHGDDRHRDDHGEEHLGEVAREVGVESVDAARGQHGQAAGLVLVEYSGPTLGDALHEGRAKFGLRLRRRAVRSTLGRPHREGATGDGGQQQRHGQPELLEVLVLDERPGDDLGEEPCLGKDQEGGQRAEADGEGHEGARGSGVAKKALVDRPAGAATVALALLPTRRHRFPHFVARSTARCDRHSGSEPVGPLRRTSWGGAGPSPVESTGSGRVASRRRRLDGVDRYCSDKMAASSAKESRTTGPVVSTTACSICAVHAKGATYPSPTAGPHS